MSSCRFYGKYENFLGTNHRYESKIVIIWTRELRHINVETSSDSALWIRISLVCTCCSPLWINNNTLVYLCHILVNSELLFRIMIRNSSRGFSSAYWTILLKPEGYQNNRRNDNVFIKLIESIFFLNCLFAFFRLPCMWLSAWFVCGTSSTTVYTVQPIYWQA